MLRDITLGQYYQTESVVHRLDPRVKLVTTIAFIVSLFVVDNIAGYALAGLFLFLVIRLSKVPVKFMMRGMKSIAFLLVVAVVFNLFLTQGEVVVSFWKLRITKEGIYYAGFMAPGISDHGFLRDDADHHAESSDGRAGEAFESAQGPEGARP